MVVGENMVELTWREGRKILGGSVGRNRLRGKTS